MFVGRVGVHSDEHETDLEFPRNKTLDFLAINILDVLLRGFPTGSALTESDD